MSEHTSDPNPSPSKPQHELETLRVLLNLPPHVLEGFAPLPPAPHIVRYVQMASKPQLDWLLVDVLHQLRLRAHEQHELRLRSHGNGRAK